MKKILLLILLVFITQSCVNYYSVTVTSDTPLYSAGNYESNIVYTVPSNSTVFIKGRDTKKYRKIKYGKYVGWAFYPSYSEPGYYSSRTSSSSTTSPKRSSSYYSSPGKTVNVKGYYRKDGTYVRPHTRSAPRRK